ncbi:hypothetical protein JHK82_046370 [Glycine max]|nr:hypothetical protein JHK82_046370 [Glycine max]
MGRPSKTQVSNEFSSEEEKEEASAAAANHEIEDDDEELEAVARYVSSDDDDNSPDEAAEDDDEDKQDESNVDPEVSKREKARLREMQQLKKQKVQEILDAQNATIDADMNNRGKGRLNYLLQQTELFAHFAKGDQSSQKKAKGRGRHASKVTEEEEDEEYLKGEEDGLANTRLVTQPSCIQGKMRDYQLAGLNWLIRLYENGINGILADEMVGSRCWPQINHIQVAAYEYKYLLTCYLHEFRGITGPHMVVAPKSTLGNWMNEIRRFCPVLRAVKFLGNPDERKHIREELLVAGKFDVCVTSFEMVIKEKSALRRFSWRYIIIDEAHRIKNENSLLSKTMRLYNTNYRLLITGTPLQNNLHELWALLNFLLPEIFSSAETFDEWFQISGENDEHEVVQQLHKVLRPFLLRRLKSDVEKGLPPKKETILKVGMSQMQKQYYKALLQKDLEVVNAGGERKRLLNIAMQLRKCCNHPYLFQGAEPGPPFTTGDHLITNAGKMVLLDKLLPKLKERDSRVLIFSQMTRLLDILEDYLMFCGYQYCRIDGNTGGDDRDASIEAFNKPGSEKFVFLLSTRAGGLGINLATADVVILYDSDWQYTIEEKVIERAYKKLALDALVIQQGRLAEQKTVNKDELLQMVRFGAEMVFSSKDSTITDEDIDRIIAKGEEATAELDAKMKKFTEDAIKFKMDDTAELYDFDDENEENKFDFKKIVSENWVEPPRRERKRKHDFQFFNTHRLSELYEKEVRYLMNNLHELWALLNFLLPEIFSSAETFDEWFQISGENDEHEVVQQLHKVLRPFLLRRLKSDVEKGLPPKKETILKVGMSQMQKQYYKALLQKDLEVVNAGGERKRLLNIAMQLRKCCNHPYLFQGAEPVLPLQQETISLQMRCNKDELLQMVRFGAEMVFSSKDTAELYDFDDENDENKFDFKKIVSENWVEPPRRERKRKHDFQFFNTHRLSELYEKEVRYLMVGNLNLLIKQFQGVPLTAEELEEKEQLLEEGFSSWSRKDFNAFIRACEKYGRNDIKGIASEMEGKTQEEVERYAKVFKERYKELNDYDRIIKNIERGEARISRKDEIMKAIGKKLDRYRILGLN